MKAKAVAGSDGAFDRDFQALGVEGLLLGYVEGAGASPTPYG